MSFVSLLCPKTKFKVIWRLEAVLIHINSKHFCYIINTSLTKLVQSRWLDISLVLFKAFSMDLNAWSVKHAVYNGNRTEWNQIQSVIIPVINKIWRPRRQNSSLLYQYNIRQQMMRIQKYINKGIIRRSNTKFSELTSQSLHGKL